jgi:hypothetical protein
MLLQPRFQSGARPMQPHHRVVRGDAELSSDLADSNAINDDATEDLRMLRLQLVCLNEHTPAVEAIVIIGGSKFQLVDRARVLTLLAQLVDHHVAHEASEPGLDTRSIAKLIGSFESALEGRLKHFLGVEAASTAVTNHGKQVVTLVDHGLTDPALGLAGVDKCFHHFISEWPQTPARSTLFRRSVRF